jgi:hypothetical protein
MDVFNAFTQGINASQGQKMAKDERARNAFVMQQAQDEAEQARQNREFDKTMGQRMAAGEPRTDMRRDAMAAGRFDLVDTFNAADEAQRTTALANFDRMGSVATQILQMPPERQGQALMFVASQYGPEAQEYVNAAIQSGLSPTEVLQSVAASAIEAKTLFEASVVKPDQFGDQYFSVQSGALGNAAQVAPMARRDPTFAEQEDERSSRAAEGLRGQEVNIARQNAATSRMRASQPQSAGIVVGQDAEGRPIVSIGGPAGAGSPFGNASNSRNAQEVAGLREIADTAAQGIAMNNQFLNLLDEGYQTSALAPITGQAARFGLGSKKEAEQFERARAYNNEMAALRLKLFGGSDTERELMVSMQISPAPDKLPESNRQLIAEHNAKLEIQRQKPEFASQWASRYGSLDAMDPQTGVGFQGAWDQYLQSQFPEVFSGRGNSPEGPSRPRKPTPTSALSAEEQAELDALRAEFGQ